MALLGTLTDHRARRALFLLGAAALLLAGLVTWKARDSVSAQMARSVALERNYAIQGQDLHVQVSVGSVAATAEDAETDRLLGRAAASPRTWRGRRALPLSAHGGVGSGAPAPRAPGGARRQGGRPRIPVQRDAGHDRETEGA